MEILLNALYKGGVAKTTQNFIFANLLARKGYRVLFLDFDPQMNGTMLLTGMEKNDDEFKEKNIYKAIEEDNMEANILNVKENIDIVPGSKIVNLFEDLMVEKEIKQFHLYFKILLEDIANQEVYDFVLMDMGPAKSKLNTAVMATATAHIVITQAEVLSMDNIQEYIEDIEELKEYGAEGKILGIAVGMQNNSKINLSVVEAIKEAYPELVFNTIIKRRTRLQEYALTGFPEETIRGTYAKEDSNALRLHIKLLAEVLGRLNVLETEEV